MNENGPSDIPNIEPEKDFITITQERRKSWGELKNDVDLIKRLEELLDEALKDIDLKNLNLSNIAEIRKIIYNHINVVNRYPVPLFLKLEKTDEGKITEIVCTTLTVPRLGKQREIKFSKII